MDSKFERYIVKNRNINRGFRKLEVWKEAIELFVFIKKNLKSKRNMSFKIINQINDQTLSVSSNIEEYGKKNHDYYLIKKFSYPT